MYGLTRSGPDALQRARGCQAHVEVGIVEEAAREAGMPMLMTAQATQLFRAAGAAGFVDGDDLGVAHVIERLAGL